MNCAHATIELIKAFWPHSIDILRRERGIVSGSRPVFLSDWTDAQEMSFFESVDEYVVHAHDTSNKTHMGISDVPIELGARQCKQQLDYFGF